MYILYAFQCEILHQTISFNLVLVFILIQSSLAQFSLCFYFCFQYVLSLTIPLYIFDLGSLKIILEVFLWAFTVQSIPVTFHNFKTNWLPILYSQTIPTFSFSNSICSCNLSHIHYQCLSQSKLSLTYGNQRSQHPENEPKITRNSETRWKLISSVKTDISGFKRERNF